MSEIWYTAQKKFDPSLGKEWGKYQDWAKIPQLTELISLDTTYRPQELWDLVPSDWQHNIHQDYRIAFFTNLDYLLERFSNKHDSINILAISLEPTLDVQEIFKDGRFVFMGYDLTGKGDVSAITNCGGFDKAFQNSDISPHGLFTSFSFARKVQKLLVEYYPDEYHAHCELWAIWKMASW
jgi:hypothetical protein